MVRLGDEYRLFKALDWKRIPRGIYNAWKNGLCNMFDVIEGYPEAVIDEDLIAEVESDMEMRASALMDW